MKHEHIEEIVDILKNQAVGAPAGLGPAGYFRDLVHRTSLPDDWVAEVIGAARGVPEVDARELVNWALNKGGNPAEEGCTTLGSLLKVELRMLGVEKRLQVAVLIIGYLLCSDAEIRKMVKRYDLPYYAPQRIDAKEESLEDVVEGVNIGADVDWADDDEVELQGWFRNEPQLQDVGFYSRMVERARSVCRIEFDGSERQGTGFLIGNRLALTNYHVLAGKGENGQDHLQVNARQVRLCFGKLTSPEGGEETGHTFRLVKDQPVIGWSSDKELDYALLHVEQAIDAVDAIKPAPFTLEVPYEGMSLNLLQHPLGGSMQLGISGDGVDKVYTDRGLVRYSTRAHGGSSGSPCLTDSWEVIALHHAERSTRFGSVREGILFKNIHHEIADRL